jgi:membrane-anchored mycosin MYCP
VRRGLMRGLAVAAALAAAVPPAVLGSAPAASAAPECAQAGQDFPGIPWQQQLLAPDRVRSFSRGTGVTVAVLASGVDANQPQLHGHVAAGFDATTGTGTGNTDCVGLGTQIAGVIAAQPVNGIALVGLAPNVTILPVRVVASAFGGAAEANPAVLAKGIAWAAGHGADVIDVPLATYTDDPALRAAVADAQERGVLVVAATGAARDASPPPYPAAYGSVLGVGAVDQNVNRYNGSPAGPWVGLVAPGAAVVTLQRDHGMIPVDGTGIASAFVAATAALVRARVGESATPDVITRRLFATATPTPGGPAFGHGLVNPYAAVTEQLVAGTPAALPAMGHPAGTDAGDDAQRRTWAAVGVGVGVLVVLAVLLAALAVPRGRRRAWRPALAPAPPPRPDPEPGPPIQLFDEVPNRR